MRKILFISHDSFLFGATRSLADLVEGLIASYGYTVKVLLPYDAPFRQFLEGKNIDHEVIDYVDSIKYLSNPKYRSKRLSANIKMYSQFKKVVSEFRPDAVYLNTSVMYFGVFVFKLLGIKTILHIREFGKEDYGIVHDWREFPFKIALRNADLVLSNSKAIQHHYLHKYGIKSTVLYNGVCSAAEFDTRRALAQEVKSSRGPTITVGMVGTINKNKGQLLLLEAFNAIHGLHPNVRLAYYGNGDGEGSLRQAASSYGILDKVGFMGFVENLDHIYPNLDVLVMASQNEAFGRVTVEAISYGVFVVGSDNAGTKEILGSNNGLLYNGTLQGLQDALIQALSDEALRARTIEQAHQFCKHSFSREKYVSSFVSIFENFLS